MSTMPTLSVPAMPAAVRTKSPDPSRTPIVGDGGVLAVASPMSERLAFATPTLTTFVPALVVVCSKVTSAVRVWPATVSTTPSPDTRR